MAHTLRRWIAPALAVLLTACATPESLQPGTPRADVLARLGPPTRSVSLPAGERLQYDYQFGARQAVMVDLDAAGRVQQARQVLNERDFAHIAIDGSWTHVDVEREFGLPYSVGRVGSWDGPIWAYRWRGGMVDQLFWVYLDGAGTVRRTQTGMDPQNFRDLR